MSQPLDSWDKAAAFALTLPGTERGLSARMPTIKVAANDRHFIWTGRETRTSFAMWVEDGEAEMLMETDPGTFWQSPHYAGSQVILIRYTSDDPDRVRHMIEQAHARAAEKRPVRKRRT